MMNKKQIIKKIEEKKALLIAVAKGGNSIQEKEYEYLYKKTITNEDVIASLSDQLYNIMRELEILKENVKRD